MTNSIRVKSASEYIIEVNDQGETISFDVTDTSLTSRLVGAMEKIDSLVKVYEERATQIEARPDAPYNTVKRVNEQTGEEETQTLISQNQFDSARLIEDFYVEARAAMDTFLGAGACQKIFGGKNYLNMFNDLLEQLEPHFQKMGVNAENLKNKAVEKHSPNRAQRRALK